MFGSIFSILLLWVAGIAALPSLDKYTETIWEIRKKSTGLPDPELGKKLAKLRPGHKNLMEQGSYFEGDILTPPRLTRNGIIETEYRWSKGIVPYKITGTYTTTELNNINAAIASYHQNTCIKFRAATTADVDYITIESGTGCSSALGRNGGQQKLTLQPGVGTPIHELMHAIGFFHEQSRMDRDDFITILWENITPGKEHNFNAASSTPFGIPYDYSSVMHYGKDYFTKNGLDTIAPKQAGVTLGQRIGFTEYDMAKIRRMYRCYGAESLL